LLAEYIQIAGSHFDSGIGLSSKMVPFLTLNRCLQDLQRHSERVEMNPISRDWQ
jgi:hypothetical protein